MGNVISGNSEVQDFFGIFLSLHFIFYYTIFSKKTKTTYG